MPALDLLTKLKAMRIASASLVVSALALVACGGGGTEPEPPPPVGVISLNVGESRELTAAQAASPIEVSGGSAGAEFVLVAFHGSQSSENTAALVFNGTQVSAASGPPNPGLAPAGGAQLSAAPGSDAASLAALRAAARFHADLRRMEQGELGRKLAARRLGRASSGLAPLSSTSVGAAAPVPNPGDPVSLNTNKDRACDNAFMRAGRVAAVTQYAVIVADNANPSGGFTDAEYASIGQEFDTKVYPLITQNFLTPGDIDQNEGKVVIFYTRAVNELTPANSESIVGGFFHPRDLFPKAGSATLEPCPTSNEAEMFYMLVPDPNGEVNNNQRDKDAVRRQTVGVIAHEFQHLINASRRMYVNNASAFEDVWLNEGLSHIAEELLFFQEAGLAPRQNITLSTLQSSQTILDAVNTYQVSNLARLVEWAEDPEDRSPFAKPMPSDPIDDLAVRGAAWQLLRYAADHSTTPQQTLWRNLANARTAGITNFTAAFGDFVPIVKDWATAQYTDDAGIANFTTARLQHPSWHYRSILPRLVNPERFPLKTRPLVAGTTVQVTLKGGAAAYLRFRVAGGATGTVTASRSGGAALPETVSLTLVRTR